jgi:hypothetical protein
VTDADVSTDDIRRMADHTVFTRGARRALVVGRTLVYGLTRMFQIITGARAGDIEIFTDRAEAELWLDQGFGGPEPGAGDVASDGRTTSG